jgi:hypothetical protein
VNSAAFRQAAMRDVEQFMLEHEYSHPLGVQKLTSRKL